MRKYGVAEPGLHQPLDCLAVLGFHHYSRRDINLLEELIDDRSDIAALWTEKKWDVSQI